MSGTVVAPASGTERIAYHDAEATRARILAAAEREFAEKGLAGARVDAIAEAANANKRMLYYYFGNKDGLYVAVLEGAYAAMRRAERELDFDHLPPVEAVCALIGFKFDYYAAKPEIIRLLAFENLNDAGFLKRSARLHEMQLSVVETLRRVLARGVEEGSIRRGVDPLQLYLSVAGLAYFTFANAATLSTSFGEDVATPAARRVRRAHVIEVILAYIRPLPPGAPVGGLVGGPAEPEAP